MAFAKRCPPPLLRPPARRSAAGSSMSGSMISPRPTRPTSRLSTRGGATSAAGGTAMIALSSLTRPSLNALEAYEPVAFELGGERTQTHANLSSDSCHCVLGRARTRSTRTSLWRSSSGANELGCVHASLRSDSCHCVRGPARTRTSSNALKAYKPTSMDAFELGCEQTRTYASLRSDACYCVCGRARTPSRRMCEPTSTGALARAHRRSPHCSPISKTRADQTS